MFICLHGCRTERQTRGSGADCGSKVISTCLSSLKKQGISERKTRLILLQVWLKETYLPAYLRDFNIKQTQIKGSVLPSRSSWEFSVDFKGVRPLSLKFSLIKITQFFRKYSKYAVVNKPKYLA